MVAFLIICIVAYVAVWFYILHKHIDAIRAGYADTFLHCFFALMTLFISMMVALILRNLINLF